MREKQIMTLEEAVRKLTFMVASIFGLPDRGLLRRGMAADLCVFDSATIRECDPHMVQDLPGNEKRFVQKSVGIEMTIVNGQVLVEKDNHTGALPGAVLTAVSTRSSTTARMRSRTLKARSTSSRRRWWARRTLSRCGRD